MAELKTKKTELSVAAFLKKYPRLKNVKMHLQLLSSWRKPQKQKAKCGDHPLSVLATSI